MKYSFNEEFFSIQLYVNNKVLTPRNETEILVDKVLKEIKFIQEAKKNFILIDIWTWSACIPIAILKNIKTFPQETFALDISLDAIKVARINIEYHNLQDKIKLLYSDLLEVFLKPLPASPYQGRSFPLIRGIEGVIITANLPYIKNQDFENIDKEVLKNDPHIALFGWEKTGFEMYEKLIWQIFEFKKIFNLKNIILFIEIWFDQYDYSRQYLSNLWLKFEYFKDLNNIHRVIKIEL